MAEGTGVWKKWKRRQDWNSLAPKIAVDDRRSLFLVVILVFNLFLFCLALFGKRPLNMNSVEDLIFKAAVCVNVVSAFA